MGLLDEVRALLRREARDAKEIMGQAVADANAGMERAERRTSADPDERLAATLEDIEASEGDFEAIRARADAGAGAASVRPAADAEPAGEEPDADDAEGTGGLS